LEGKVIEISLANGRGRRRRIFYNGKKSGMTTGNKLLTWEQSVLWLREQPEQRELVRACYYDDPLLDAAQRFASSAEWRGVLDLLPQPAGRALDFGAGRGISSYALAAAGWDVTALEPNPSDLIGTGAIRALAKESGLAIHVAQGIAEEMDFGDGVFDLVYTREVLHHARDLNSMLREAARALKPGGMFIACREHVIRRKADLQTFQNNHALHRFYGGENAYLLDEYLSAIRASGLKVQKVYGYYETVVNYFPLTDEEQRAVVYSPITKWLGKPLTSFLCKFDLVNKTLAYIASRKNYFPGILHTFVAVKPK
jgi:2-polyprenyl-3-methyl-5-hydroxy-6-metoxy-1,4-benzoquinol methylase